MQLYRPFLLSLLSITTIVNGQTKSVHDIALLGTAQELANALKNGKSIDERNDLKQTLLLVAVDGANADTVAYLLKKGASMAPVQTDVHIVDPTNPSIKETPFHQAVYSAVMNEKVGGLSKKKLDNNLNNLVRIIELLASYDKDKSIINYGVSPLQQGSTRGVDPRILIALIKAGAVITDMFRIQIENIDRYKGVRDFIKNNNL